jgi:hypothetical protein
MRLGAGLRKGTVERLKAAIVKDPSVIADPKTINNHEGSTLAHMESLGLKKTDLKRLERYGFAIRGYTPNYWEYKDTEGTLKGISRGPGMEVRWVLLATEEHNGGQSEQAQGVTE